MPTARACGQIAEEIADLAKRAQARKIGPDEMGGASMSISNLGGIGGTAFTPIVNPGHHPRSRSSGSPGRKRSRCGTATRLMAARCRWCLSGQTSSYDGIA
jgi:hypothetical protein